jgi:large subunit ribosomal protein L10
LNRNEKEMLVADMKSRLKRAKAIFVVDYQGLDVEAMNRIRGELRKIDTEFQVVKNRLIKLASQDTETESILEQFAGPCALTFAYDDVIAPAKVLVELSKDYQSLQVKIGQISGRPIDLDVIKRLAELPGRDQLLAQMLSTMQAVPASLVRVLNGILINLLNVLTAIGTMKDNEE